VIDFEDHLVCGMAGYGNHLNAKGAYVEDIPIPYQGGLMIRDMVIHPINFSIVDPFKGSQAPDMVSMIMGNQYPQNVVFIVFDEVEHRFIHIAGVNDDGFPGLPGISSKFGSQDVTVTETTGTIMKK
jgi:hypothetical protein